MIALSKQLLGYFNLIQNKFLNIAKKILNTFFTKRKKENRNNRVIAVYFFFVYNINYYIMQLHVMFLISHSSHLSKTYLLIHFC